MTLFISSCLKCLRMKQSIAWHTMLLNLGGYLKFYCCIADDENKNIRVFSHKLDKGSLQLKSLTPVVSQLHIFEREIHENFGVEFNGHPWLKPVRYPMTVQINQRSWIIILSTVLKVKNCMRWEWARSMPG